MYVYAAVNRELIHFEGTSGSSGTGVTGKNTSTGYGVYCNAPSGSCGGNHYGLILLTKD